MGKNKSLAKLVDMVTWGGFIGWQGVTCHHCGTTYNVFCGIPCILCEKCGSCITLSWFGHWQRPHENPDVGWGRALLNWATTNHGRYREYLWSVGIKRAPFPA